MSHWSKFETEEDFRAAFARHYVVDLKTGCWNWIGAKMGGGYGTFRYRGRQEPAHRVMYGWVNGPVLCNSVIRHKCDNKSCVNPDHLISGSQSDNVRDAWRVRRLKQESKERPPKMDRLEKRRLHGDCRCKLTEEQAIEAMRMRMENRMTYQAIGDHFGVTEGAIRQIVHGERWGYLGGAEPKRVPRLGEGLVREIKLQRRLAGMTYDQLSSLFGISTGAVGMALNR